ncbi:hypothetical protein F5X97DRAFT_312902 [Nemania serpens]|nr:hypothetical protein F5X97DRAFT_312902 [Nemania serpens]
MEGLDKVTPKKRMSTTDESSDAAPEWTKDEYRTLCVRKSESKSWSDICKELGRGKKDCKERYHKLSSYAKELGVTADKLARLYVDEDEKADAKSKSKKSGKGNGNGKDKGKYADEDEDKHESKAKDGKDKGKGKKGATKSDPKLDANSKSKRGKNKKIDSDLGSNSDDEEGEAEDEDEDEEADSDAEYRAQSSYIYGTVYGTLYPDQKALRPDRFYSESDCRVLAGLEARYRAHKWLLIQADFRNATGRMVEAEILKAKFYEDQN